MFRKEIGTRMNFSLRTYIKCIGSALMTEVYWLCRKQNAEKYNFSGGGVKNNLKYLWHNIFHYKTGEEVRFVFNDKFVDRYLDMTIETGFDAEKELFYVFHNGKRLYMKKGFSREDAINYYRSILVEQDKESPHCYFTNHVNNLDGKVIVDCGAAEGNFIIDYIEQIKKVYFFEAEEQWIEALKATYEPWLDKVEFVCKFVSDYNDDTHIALSSYFQEINVKPDIIKLDIEGDEVRGLKDIEKIIKKTTIIFVCVYHYDGEEKEVVKLLNDFHIKRRRGTMLMIWFSKLKAPYLRNGVLECSKECR